MQILGPKGLDSVLGEVLSKKPTKREKESRNVEALYLKLLRTHPFLKDNDLHKSLEKVANTTKSSPKQKELMGKYVDQWQDAKVRKYFWYAKDFDFIKLVDKANAYRVLLSGSLLSEKQLNWISVSVREFKYAPHVFEFFYENADFKFNSRIFDMLIQNKHVPDSELGFILSKVEDSFIRRELKYKRLVFQKFKRQADRSNQFHKQLLVMIEKNVPLTTRQFECLEDSITPIKKEDLKKSVPITLPQRRRVRSI